MPYPLGHGGFVKGSCDSNLSISRLLFALSKILSGQLNSHGFAITLTNVRSGIRTHAYLRRLRPERSALDHSAILT